MGGASVGRRAGVALVVVATVLGLGGGVASAHSGGSGVEVKKPWARASAAMASAGAVYMVLKNESKSDDALVGASVPSSVAGEAQIHETVTGDHSMGDSMDSTSTTMSGMASGTMSMREVAQIDIPAGGKVKLEPGGYHIMLLDLVEPLEEGSKVKVTLEFESGSSQTVKAVVKK